MNSSVTQLGRVWLIIPGWAREVRLLGTPGVGLSCGVTLVILTHFGNSFPCKLCMGTITRIKYLEYHIKFDGCHRMTPEVVLVSRHLCIECHKGGCNMLLKIDISFILNPCIKHEL